MPIICRLCGGEFETTKDGRKHISSEHSNAGRDSLKSEHNYLDQTSVSLTPRISTRVAGRGVPQYDNYFREGI